MNRLIISNGSYTTLIVNSILQNSNQHSDNNYFLGYFKKISPKSIQNHYNFANYTIKYKHFYNFEDYNTNNSFNFKKLYQTMNVSSLDEVYIPINTTTKKWVKAIKKLLPNITINLYEEGLLSYIKPIYDSKLQKIMKNSNNYYLFYHNKLKIQLEKNCKDITFITINKNILQSVITKYSDNINLNLNNFIKPNEKYALILPQYYYENSPQKMTLIIKEYEKITRDLLAKGYYVLFKDHPKAKNSFFTILQKEIEHPKLNLLPNISNYPAEVLIHKINPELVFSVYSTSLLSINYLFNIPTFTSNTLLKQRMNFISIFPTISCIAIKDIIPDIFNNKTAPPSKSLWLKLYLIVLKTII